MSSLAHKALDYILNIWLPFFPFFSEANHSLREKKKATKNGDLNVGGLNAGGQISLSCYK